MKSPLPVEYPEWASAAYLQAVFGLSYYRLRQIEQELVVARPGGGYRLYQVESVRRYLERQTSQK